MANLWLFSYNPPKAEEKNYIDCYDQLSKHQSLLIHGDFGVSSEQDHLQLGDYILVWVTMDDKDRIGLYGISKVVYISTKNPGEIWIASEVAYNLYKSPITYYSCLNNDERFRKLSQDTRLKPYYGFKLCDETPEKEMLETIKEFLVAWNTDNKYDLNIIDKIILEF